jgi:hypothetical protein
VDYYDDRALGTTLESLPDEVVAGLEVRDAWRQDLAKSTDGLEFIVVDLARWPVGSVVRVAFLDGDTTLHSDIEAATSQITAATNLTLDFGRDQQTGEYRRWSEKDTVHNAEIRVSFDMGGYWSFVGTDSTDPTIAPVGPIGGGPGQRSLNLGGFKTNKPRGWEGTVRHEFLHALAFEHEHQNMRGPCEGDFRWENDPGYVPTTNANGAFIPDAQGRRPGIYTYLAGPPNRWSKAKVDHNLRTAEDPKAVASGFDPASVMLYRFAPFFYKSDPSPCAPKGDGVNLSDGDKRALSLLYPGSITAVNALAAQSRDGLELLTAGNKETSGEEGVSGPSSAYGRRLIELLTAHAAAGSKSH